MPLRKTKMAFKVNTSSNLDDNHDEPKMSVQNGLTNHQNYPIVTERDTKKDHCSESRFLLTDNSPLKISEPVERISVAVDHMDRQNEHGDDGDGERGEEALHQGTKVTAFSVMDILSPTKFNGKINSSLNCPGIHLIRSHHHHPVASDLRNCSSSAVVGLRREAVRTNNNFRRTERGVGGYESDSSSLSPGKKPMNSIFYCSVFLSCVFS